MSKPGPCYELAGSPPTIPEQPLAPTLTRKNSNGSLSREVWELPTEETYLEALLRDIFCNDYAEMRFGPIIEGAAYEIRPPGPPKFISMFDGYMTVMFDNGGHFHLCIGEHTASPPDLRARRKPGYACLFVATPATANRVYGVLK